MTHLATSAVVELAEKLLATGLPRAACRLLATSPESGFAINEARRRALAAAATQRLAPAIYCPVVCEGTGLTLPLSADLGLTHRATLDDRAEVAVQHANQLVTRFICRDDKRPPRLALHIDRCFAVEGASIGLAAALAFAAKLIGRTPAVPVIATGELSSAGQVLPVAHLAVKVAAALDDLGDEPGVVLVPVDGAVLPHDKRLLRVENLRGAWPLAFGCTPFALSAELLRLEQVLADAGRASSPAAALELLEAFGSQRLAPADRASLLFAQGNHLRHSGHPERAVERHAEARRLAHEERDALSAEVIETMELEHLANDAGTFQLDALMETLSERLHQPFVQPYNRVQCRGLLAQVEAMLGHPEVAVDLREENLFVQARSASLGRDVSRTRACLVLEAALAGNHAVFERHAAQLLADAHRESERQNEYSFTNVLRGLVLLGHERELLAWLENGHPLFGHTAPALLKKWRTDPEPTCAHPRISALRSLARALRRVGQPEDAIEVVDRIAQPDGPPLLAWLCRVGQIEAALARLDFGQIERVKAELSRLTTELGQLYEPAARHHAELVRMLGEESGNKILKHSIEQTLDDVYF